MPDLNHLKVDQVPDAFADWAKKHNELVDLIASIEAAHGIDIKITHRPQKVLSVPGSPGKTSKLPKGRIIIGLKAAGGTGPIPGGGGGGSSVGNVAVAIGYAGTLTEFLQPVSPNVPTQYPEYLKVGNIVSAVFDANLISHDITVRTFVGCNSGNAANYQTFASDFF